MSYDISIVHSSVKQKVEAGEELDAFEHQPLEEDEIKAFLDRLPGYGYQLELETPEIKSFVKQVMACPIQVTVFDTEISFSVPYWENAEQAIFEALQDASEMCDSGKLALYDPQTGEWPLDALDS